jgi:predicted RNA-binding Zn ribbon-like protein
MDLKRFELIGGALCLDFLNTIHEYGAADPREELETFQDLVAFARNSAAISDRDVVSFQRLGASNPRQAGRTLIKAREFREALYRMFSGMLSTRESSQEHWKLFNRLLSDAYRNVGIQKKGANIFWTWNAERVELDGILWPIVRSAAELLTSEKRLRVRECSSETCTWLFLDLSKNGRRRWCEMKTCGNRAKWRRHYDKTRKRRKVK